MTDKITSPAPARADMANVMFNFAQRAGHTLTSDDAVLFDKLRKRWDAAPAQAPVAEYEYALRMLVAAGHITQDKADEALALAEKHAPALAADRDVFGWALVGNDDLSHQVRERYKPFFGGTLEAGPFDADDLARADREFAGLAPFRCITLYTAPQAPQPCEQCGMTGGHKLQCSYRPDGQTVLPAVRATPEIAAPDMADVPRRRREDPEDLTHAQIVDIIRPLCGDEATTRMLVARSMDEYRAVIAADRAIRTPGMTQPKTEEPVRYCWSHDGEEYHDELPSREDAMHEALAALVTDGVGEPGDIWTVHTGVCRPAISILRSIAESIGSELVERLEEWLCDDITSDHPIIELPKGRHADLGNAVLDFMAQHAEFKRYGVGEEQEHEEEIPGDADSSVQVTGIAKDSE